MHPSLKLISILAGMALFSGCQMMSSDLEQVNEGLSQLTGQAMPATANHVSSNKSTIKNRWKVSPHSAVAWLTHNQSTWNNHGKLKGVNWYQFWASEIHAHTSLAKQAYHYCHQSAWSAVTPGANCQTYFQAYSMTNAEESQQFGKAMINDE